MARSPRVRHQLLLRNDLEEGDSSLPLPQKLVHMLVIQATDGRAVATTAKLRLFASLQNSTYFKTADISVVLLSFSPGGGTKGTIGTSKSYKQYLRPCFKTHHGKQHSRSIKVSINLDV